MIRQGDQYCVPIKIKKGDAFLTPSDIQDIKIQIGEVEKTYSKDELLFDENCNSWLFPITQENTLNLDEIYQVQAQINFGNDSLTDTPVIVTSNLVSKKIGASIIKTTWEEQE